jgi:hypothetical protein
MMRKAIIPLTLAAVFIATAALAQGNLRGTLTAGYGDVAALKRNAEAGDAAAQLALGDVFVSHCRATEALQWYRKAAAQGNVEAKYQVGQMLLFGGFGSPKALEVKPNHAEGIRWTYMAATNGHALACDTMARVLKEGIGTSTNLIAAYAWLKLFAETPGGSIVGRVHLNELALKMDTDSLRRAEALAARFKAGQWRVPTARAIPDGDPNLKLGGITFGNKKALAVINGKTLAEGESASLPFKSGRLAIKCLKIERDSVLVSLDGEDAPRLLHLR